MVKSLRIPSFKQIQLILLVIFILGTLTALVLIKKQTDTRSRASSDTSQEAESGLKTGNVSTGSDTTASSGQYIQFGNPQLPQPTTISTPAATNPTPTAKPVQAFNAHAVLGSSVSPWYFNDSRSEATLKQYHFSLLAMENELKPQMVLWGLDQNSFMDTSRWNWGGADQEISVAKRNGWQIHGHTLVWHSNNPTFFNNLPNDQLKTFLQTYVTTVTSHYCGQLDSLDVVNEAFGDDGNPLPSGIWTPTSDYSISIWNKAFGGSDYIKLAFQWAHAACPSMKLYLNDYNAEAMNSKSNGIYTYIKNMKAQGVPIDGYGMQLHQGNISGQFEYGFADPTSVANNMKRFADIGVLVRISEYDQLVHDHTASTLSDQAKKAGALAAVCYAASNCTSFTVWGLTDGVSWYNGISPQPSDGKGYTPLLFDTNFNPKANYWTVHDALHLP